MACCTTTITGTPTLELLAQLVLFVQVPGALDLLIHIQVAARLQAGLDVLRGGRRYGLNHCE